MSLTPKVEERIAFGFAVFVGALVWIVSPYVTGEREPWDSPGFYYKGTLLFGGCVAGLLVPQRFWRWAVGAWLGQIVGFLYCMATSPRVGPLAPLGFFFFLPLTSLWSLLGACVGAAVGKLLRRQIRGK